MIQINYKKFENNKKKENNEPFDLEKYIDDIELYRKQRKILDMVEFLRYLEKERIERMIRLQKKPEIIVKLVKLDTSLDKKVLERLGITTKPRKENKIKIEWIE